jgi:hypothetical protein
MGMEIEPPINEASVSSHTRTEHGVYDDEPIATEGNAYYWYMRAVYWKHLAHRKEGVQAAMNFEEKSAVVDGQIILSPADLKIVKSQLDGLNPVKILAAIKYVRTITGCGLKEAKDYLEAL